MNQTSQIACNGNAHAVLKLSCYKPFHLFKSVSYDCAVLYLSCNIHDLQIL